MPLNLLHDQWIPAQTKSGLRKIIAPWQIADAELARLDWPRADLNLACLELLIGLVFLADPPETLRDWRARKAPDPERLRSKLEGYGAAFNMTGPGPLFLQDFEVLGGEPSPVDMLYIDSAGENTAKKNADLMVHRDRYQSLDLAQAAMALYTLQAHAPSGGAGNRTSMRGGGPMVTLVDPGGGLWPLIWANVPYGRPGDVDALPWMRPTQTSEAKGSERYPQQGTEAEAFFGTPRRLRLVVEGDRVTGVVQRPYGANYAGWQHPLTPYYRMKEGAELLPKHPKAGAFGYRNWLGVVAPDAVDALTEPAQSLRLWHDRSGGEQAHLIVAGWAMNNMTPVDFVWSEPPLFGLTDDQGVALRGMIRAADVYRSCLRGALGSVLGEGQTRDAALEEFYSDTEAAFEHHIAAMIDLDPASRTSEIAKEWLRDMRFVVLGLFDRHAMPGLADRPVKEQQRIVSARGQLLSSFQGRKGLGRKAFDHLELEPLASKEEEAV